MHSYNSPHKYQIKTNLQGNLLIIIIFGYRVLKVRLLPTLVCSACCNCNCNCHVAASCQLTVRKLKFICIFDLPIVINMHTECRERDRERGEGCETDRKSGESVKHSYCHLMGFFNEASLQSTSMQKKKPKRAH